MRRAINRFVILIVDPLDDVSLLSHPAVWKNAVSRGKIFQVGFERTDVGRRPARNIFPRPSVVATFCTSSSSGEFADPHAHRVARMDQSVRERLDAAVGAIGISRRPISRALDFTGLNRPIADGGAGQKPVVESDRVDKRLKRGSDLPIGRRQRAIEFALRVIAAADQRADSAAGVIDRDHRAFADTASTNRFSVLRRPVVRFHRMTEIGLVLDLGQLRLERLLGGVLHGGIERGVDLEPAVIDLVLGQQADSNPAAPRPSRNSPGSGAAAWGAD